MPRMFLRILVTALLMGPAAYGQSLGDAARENRDKKQTEDASGTTPKVITNKDLPKDPDANLEPPDAKPGANTPASSADDGSAEQRFTDQRSVQQRLAERRAADQWKRQILAQKSKVANLQARVDQLHATIQSAGGSVQYESPVSRYQARQLERLAQMQQRLDEQKVKLDQIQEAARHAGMHTPVYDP